MKLSEASSRFGSDVMADMLRMLDIEYAVINPGSSYRGLHDSIVNYLGNKKPELILCNHEGIAIAMAQGYAKVTGTPLAALLHNVVGLLNGTLAIYNAWLDEIPMLIIGATGPMDIETRRPGIDWYHTALVQGNAVRDFVKWDDQPSTMAGVPDAFIRAYQIATTDPQGPVYLCFDTGLQEDPCPPALSLPVIKRYPKPSSSQIDADTVERVAKLLVKAKNPVVIADYLGRNPGAVASLVELAELLALPVIDAGGRFNFPNTHPLDATGIESGLIKEADVVLALDVHHLYKHLTATAKDTRKSGYIIPEKCQVIHFSLQHLGIKSWSHSYGKLTMVDLPVAADTAIALPVLIAACRDMLTEKRRIELQKRLARFKARHELLRQQWQAIAVKEQDKRPISKLWLEKEVWEVIKNEDWALVNKDMRGGWARRLWNLEKPHQYAGGSGLGCGLGHALGAALAHKKLGRLCIDFQPDGDMLFTPAALWTAAHHQIPLLIIMDNNRTYYNSERHQEILAKTRSRSVNNASICTRIDGPPVNYAGLARDFGIYGVGPIENPNDLRPALEEAVRFVKKKKLPALIDVFTSPNR